MNKMVNSRTLVSTRIQFFKRMGQEKQYDDYF